MGWKEGGKEGGEWGVCANLSVRVNAVFYNPGRKEGSVDVLPVMVELGVGEVDAFAEEADYADGAVCLWRRGCVFLGGCGHGWEGVIGGRGAGAGGEGGLRVEGVGGGGEGGVTVLADSTYCTYVHTVV